MTFKSKHLLWMILFLAAILRFWGLGSAEVFHDEGFYAFRSISYLDYIQNEDQTTPIQWFKDSPFLPWWISLSFHDHPPLFFFIQNIFFKVFGDSLFAARLPSVIAGLFSVFIIYLLFRRLFQNEYAGLIGAIFLAVNHIHIWISRSSLMESLLIFLILLNIYFFFRFLDDRRRWPLFGITLGLIFLTKYTGVFIVPVYIFYIFILKGTTLLRRETTEPRFAWSATRSEAEIGARRSGLAPLERENRGSHRSRVVPFFLAFGLALLIFSPVIIYNIFLYKTTGHFDLQIAYFLGQDTPEWQASVGKIQEPFSNIITNLLAMYSIPFLLAVIGGLIYSFYLFYSYGRVRIAGVPRSGAEARYSHAFFGLILIFLTLILIPAGSAYRFISLYAIPFVFFATIFFVWVFSILRTPDVQKLKSQYSGHRESQYLTIFKIIFVAFLIYELFFAIQGIFLEFPDFGVVKLDNYFNEVFDDKRSLAVPESSNSHLNKVIRQYAFKYPASEKPIMIIYDENIGLSTKLWLFAKRNYYRGIPAFTVDQFNNFLRTQGIESFQDYELYFVKASEYTSLNPYFQIQSAEKLEIFLKDKLGSEPVKVIYGYDNLQMFAVYKFSL